MNCALAPPHSPHLPIILTPPVPQAFATYLLISWLTTNIIFAQVVNIVSALEWQVGGIPLRAAWCMA